MTTGHPRVAYAVVTWYGHKLQETVAHIPQGSRLLVIDTSINGWCLSKAWNYALRRLTIDEGFDVAVVSNDDVVLRHDTGQLLAEALMYRQWADQRPYMDREVLLVTPYNINRIGVRPTDPEVHGPKDLPMFEPRWGTGPDYSCWAATRKLLDVIGEFDEKFVPCYFEDNDSHYRIRGSGFEALSYAPYYHYGSQSLNGGGPISDARRQEIQNGPYERNRAYYISKWGGEPGRETFTSAFNANKQTVEAGEVWKNAVSSPGPYDASKVPSPI